MQQVIGDFIFDYDTFSWTNVTEETIKNETYCYPVKWINDWRFPLNYTNNNLVFRISATYVGESDKTLSKSTVVNFISEGKTFHPLFIIHDLNNVTNNENLTRYSTGSIKLKEGDEITLYFGSQELGGIELKRTGTNKLNLGLYNGIITIFDDDENYSQAFPFVGMHVIS